MEKKTNPEEPAEETQQEPEQEEVEKEPETEGLKDTDTLPSEAIEATKSKPKSSTKEETPTKKKKIIGVMGIEHDVGPPGSTHG